MPIEPGRELPRNFIRPCVLLLLREEPAHGYDLLQRLSSLGIETEDAGRLYRALRALEQDGLVRSSWQASSTGPDRRTYELTRRGMEHLHAHARGLAAALPALERFLTRYSEFADVRVDDALAARRS